MVKFKGTPTRLRKIFQYSLCRVVLMVLERIGRVPKQIVLSVLALSSRFDGRPDSRGMLAWTWAFSTRSVESF